eukprot:629872-Pyramimonas_sp.AAC.1
MEKLAARAVPGVVVVRCDPGGFETHRSVEVVRRLHISTQLGVCSSDGLLRDQRGVEYSNELLQRWWRYYHRAPMHVRNWLVKQHVAHIVHPAGAEALLRHETPKVLWNKERIQVHFNKPTCRGPQTILRHVQ